MTVFFVHRRWLRRQAPMAALTFGIAVLWRWPDFAPLFAQGRAADLQTNTKPADRASTTDAARSHEQNSGMQLTVRQKPIHPMPIQVDVNMVVLNVTVTGPHERLVTGLDLSAFEIYDNKVPQRIAAFSTEDAPISVGLIFDSSGSMAGKLERSQEAALQFLKTCNTQDEFMLITFKEHPELVGGFTSNPETVLDPLIVAQAGGTTALLDAIYVGLEKMKSATTNRKALLVISDGGDNHSRYTEGDLRHAVEESDVEIYAVGVFEPLRTRHRTQEEARGPRLLDDIAEMSGGRMFSVDDPTQLPEIMKQISLELRNQYAIGYKPSNLVRDGRWCRVKVKVNPPQDVRRVQVYARAGYYAPTQ